MYMYIYPLIKLYEEAINFSKNILNTYLLILYRK